MKIVNATRTEMYPIIGSCFKKINVSPRLIEIGVCKGSNLKSMIDGIFPVSVVLVDQWIPYSPFKDALPGSKLYKAGSKYFGGPVDDPATYENLYQYCLSTFGRNDNNLLIRKDSLSAAKDLYKLNLKYDLIYIDGGHLYEEVLNDLNSYKTLISEDGLIMLDDFVNSEEGKLQNLGVVEAVTEFLKLNQDFVPLLVTRSTDNAWCNIILAKKKSALIKIMNEELVSSGTFFVEIPGDLISYIKNSPKENCIRFYE